MKSEAVIERILEIQKECNLSNWSADDYQQESEKIDSLIYLAKTENKVIGFLAARLLLEDPSGRNDGHMYSEAEILNFGVSESFRRRGVGSLLVEKLLQNARRLSIKEIWLEVRLSNSKAISFYSTKGFTKFRTRKNFYSLPIEDGVVMKFETVPQEAYNRKVKLDSERDFEITSLRNPE